MWYLPTVNTPNTLLYMTFSQLIYHFIPTFFLRPVTSASGRHVRLGTVSISQSWWHKIHGQLFCFITNWQLSLHVNLPPLCVCFALSNKGVRILHLIIIIVLLLNNVWHWILRVTMLLLTIPISAIEPVYIKNFYLFQASMLSQPDGPFINIAKLNLSKYAQRQNLAKVQLKKL